MKIKLKMLNNPKGERTINKNSQDNLEHIINCCENIIKGDIKFAFGFFGPCANIAPYMYIILKKEDLSAKLCKGAYIRNDEHISHYWVESDGYVIEPTAFSTFNMKEPFTVLLLCKKEEWYKTIKPVEYTCNEPPIKKLENDPLFKDLLKDEIIEALRCVKKK